MTDIPPEYMNQIVTGDARELAKRIPDESIDFTLCDPVYWDVDFYSWLAELCRRVLRPGGSCIAEVGQYYMLQVMQSMSKHLDYYWLFSERLGVSARMWDKKIFVRWKPFVWFIKGGSHRTGGWMLDSLYSPRDKSEHEWGDGRGTMATLIESVTYPGDIVFDPCTGGATVPAACKVLGRQYIAFEIDPDVAERARERVRNTQPPLFVLKPEQGVMEFVE